MEKKLTFHRITVEQAGTQNLADVLNDNFKELGKFMNQREGLIKSRLDGFQRELKAISKNIKDLKSDVTVLKSDVLELKIEVSRINKKFDVLFKHLGVDPNLLIENEK